MLEPNDSVVVGVSGGSDSVALLHSFSELTEFKLRIVVAHLNHGLRGRESRRDLEFVKEIARNLGIPFEYSEVDTISFKKDNKLSIEEAARELRYRFLTEIRNKHNADKIATAHNLDDQAETVLMRFIRGSGIHGLSGIKPVSGDVIRPLIEVKKEIILEFLHSRGIEWVDDSTNRENIFLRNKIRNELLPEIESYNPSFKDMASRNAYIYKTESEYLVNEAKEEFKNIFNESETGMVGKLDLYLKLPEAIRFNLLRVGINKLKGNLKNISSSHILSIDEMLNSGKASGTITIPDSLVVVKGYDIFSITDEISENFNFNYEIPTLGLWKLSGSLEISIEETDYELKHDNNTEFFDKDMVKFPIVVRSFEPGDRFYPLGMDSQKKVKNFFIDEKVPRFYRKRIPLFLSDGKIFWVGGMRIDNRFKVVSNKNRALKIGINKSPLI